MKTIIVPTDFSPVSINAVNFAAAMAVSIDASLLLVNVYNIPVSYTTDAPIALMSIEDMKRSSESELEKIKNNIPQIISKKIKVNIESRMGNIRDELEELCQKLQPFVIVMGTKGHSGVEKMLFGSTTLTVIRHLNWPVISVPPGKEFGTGIKKIGLACDFKEVIETTPADSIKQIVNEFKAKLHVLNVDYKEKHFRPGTPEQSFLLHNLFKEINPTYHFINNADIEDGINEFAEANNLDLVITIPKKHKLFESIFKLSTTKKMVFQSHIPVMCVH